MIPKEYLRPFRHPDKVLRVSGENERRAGESVFPALNDEQDGAKSFIVWFDFQVLAKRFKPRLGFGRVDG